ncbi:PqqD family protein [bacterium]|nr:PqqD family protein [bacterium]
MDYVPIPLIASKEGGDGNVILLKPRFKAFWLRRLLIKTGRHDTLKIHLDGNGSRVWRLIDGSRTIEAIGLFMQNQPNESDEVKLSRLIYFVRTLMQNQFIRLQMFDY